MGATAQDRSGAGMDDGVVSCLESGENMAEFTQKQIQEYDKFCAR